MADKVVLEQKEFLAVKAEIDEEEAFLKWLSIELAPTLCGSKPSTILSLIDTKYRAALTIWRKTGNKMLAVSPVRTLSLKSLKDRECVLFYRNDKLKQCICQPSHQLFLGKMGYPVNRGIGACLQELQERFRVCCPHEIGIFLGIPLKDVQGFMGIGSLTETCRKEWCIYGDIQESLDVMERFAADKNHVNRLLLNGMNPEEILAGSRIWRNTA
ncbi:hypothetical protein P22_0705 [Propionispora sp. 2/2-37]|uniref:DUF3793 family protein n=1 Tax=Propionispora sp. 2/2-37 TaxID=1677858 RepID=UPI0006BB5B9F|nr:DUF3793 family protein [Propionispora sp. 2/2-37]CUH94639.1 hypothetical protein P22_0705 [Propionispora sp. 2/2-37]